MISKDNNENVYSIVIWSSIKVIICESILLPRKRPLISEKAVLNMASPDLRFFGTGGTGGPVEFFLTV